ncbi:MAG TPA: hypothetical protein PLN13_03525 [Bacteroidia bacterium]|nr:hypothetical protein [Bacteroidia bacterium]HRH07625.1 hypothetical protein [Bacteroidia bacterium]
MKENQIMSANDKSELSPDQFRNFVEQIAKLKPPMIFKNGSPSNANMIIANIYKTSSTVNLFIDNLDGKISNEEKDYIEQLSMFLDKKDSKLNVIFQGVPVKSEACTLMQAHPTNVSFKQIESDQAKLKVKAFVDTTYGENFSLKFVTGDTDKFRLQAVSQSSLNPYSAFFSFNNTEITESLNSFFKEIWELSKEYKFN